MPASGHVDTLHVTLTLDYLTAQERSELLEANRKEIQALLDARSAAESDFMDKYLASVEGYQKALDELRVADSEDYHILKIK